MTTSVAAGVLAVAGTAAHPAQAHAAPAEKMSYVALGDSYASGYGLADSSHAPVEGCHQSMHDYPHQLAAQLGLALSDVSCAAAVTADISNPQTTDAGTAPPQIAALTPSTRLVTITIGGNDLGFAAIAQYCAALTPQGPLLLLHREPTCQQHYDPNGRDSLGRDIDVTVGPAVRHVLADVRRTAPNATIIVVGYPAISTDRATAPDPQTYPSSCFSPIWRPDSFPFTAADTRYLQQTESHLNAALASAAGAGATFVDAYAPSLGHSACAGTTAPWMNGITVAVPRLSAAPGSLHPTLAGVTAIADIITPVARNALTAPASGANEQAEPDRYEAVIALGISLAVLTLAAALATAALSFARRRRNRRCRPGAERTNLAPRPGEGVSAGSHDQHLGLDDRSTGLGPTTEIGPRRPTCADGKPSGRARSCRS